MNQYSGKLSKLYYKRPVINTPTEEKRQDNRPKIPRMWTIRQVAEYAKEIDPHTSITEYRLRLWCKEGKIPYTLSSNRTMLINVDKMDEYIQATEEYNRSGLCRSNG